MNRTGSNSLRIVSWNMAHKHASWRTLGNMDVDLALLQEASNPPGDINPRIEIDPAPWPTGVRGRWRTAIARLTDRVRRVEWLEPKPLASTPNGEFAVSTPGAMSVARVWPLSGEPFVVVSMCAEWETPHSSTGSGWIYADASAHRIVSDLAIFIGRQRGNRVLAAGDLNILRGYGDGGSEYWSARYDTVFSRLGAIGLPCVGPNYPNGKQADPWPTELPANSINVPTFHSNQQSPATATRQLDFVFASKEIASQLSVRALNEPENWGPSDHCRISIELNV
ncbi:MAG: hypothetical protein F4Z01_07165 [Gammaproteobacteria bacterium]|nr:hypothetical protein [Gammaproteobacteria bacterium]MYF38971.1 hypothetical protein [Gammaproteobacteria bacterium]